MSDRVVIAQNLRSAMSTYALSSERGETLELAEAVMVSSGIDYAVFNATVFSEPVSAAGLRHVLDRAVRFYGSRSLGWSCWLCDELVESGNGLEGLLRPFGLRWVADHEGMIAERIQPARRKLPAIEVRPVADAATRRDFVHVCSHVFAVPGGVASDIYGSPRFWQGSMSAWVGYDRGRPLSIAAADASYGSVGLYSIGTMPGHQRRGYGEVMTRHAIESASGASGLSRSILQSTPAGMTLYRRMGYQSRARFSVWASH